MDRQPNSYDAVYVDDCVRANGCVNDSDYDGLCHV